MEEVSGMTVGTCGSVLKAYSRMLGMPSWSGSPVGPLTAAVELGSRPCAVFQESGKSSFCVLMERVTLREALLVLPPGWALSAAVAVTVFAPLARATVALQWAKLSLVVAVWPLTV